MEGALAKAKILGNLVSRLRFLAIIDGVGTALVVAAVAFVVAVVVLPTPVPIAFSVPAASVDSAAPVAHAASDLVV